MSFRGWDLREWYDKSVPVGIKNELRRSVPQILNNINREVGQYVQHEPFKPFICSFCDTERSETKFTHCEEDRDASHALCLVCIGTLSSSMAETCLVADDRKGMKCPIAGCTGVFSCQKLRPLISEDIFARIDALCVAALLRVPSLATAPQPLPNHPRHDVPDEGRMGQVPADDVKGTAQVPAPMNEQDIALD